MDFNSLLWIVIVLMELMLLTIVTCWIFRSLQREGKHVACLRGNNRNVEKVVIVCKVGEIGTILCNRLKIDKYIVLSFDFIPTSYLNAYYGATVFEYNKSKL